jgi:transcriptional regulator with XRE-family HTH domain
MKVRELGEFIRSQRRGAQMSLRKLSSVAGVSLPYLSQIERGLRRPSADILQAIAKALRVSSQTLYVQAGILEEAPPADVQTAVMGDPALTEGQKKVLLAVYHSLREDTERRREARRNRRQGLRPPTGGRKRASGRTEMQADSKPSPGSPPSSRSPTAKSPKGGAR